MQVGLIGLGRMGMNMGRRWLQGGHEVVAFNRSLGKVKILEEEGAVGTTSLEDFVARLDAPRVVWMMLPAGETTEEYLRIFSELLTPGDLLIDGGNSFYQDDIKRHAFLAEKQLSYMDAGVSGGIWGLKVGYCTMVGGAKEDVQRIEPLLKTLAPAEGYLHCGPVGAGHFVKMIHNGIEYGMMQAYGEGFEILKASPFADHLNFQEVAHLWNQGSVVRSWLLELLEAALAKDPNLEAIQGYVEDSGEGRWTVQQAIESGVPATSLAHALFARFRSRESNPFSERVLAALRNEFGGHAVVRADVPVERFGAGAGKVQAARAEKKS